MLDALAAPAERIDIAYLWRPRLRDVNDDRVLEAAVNGRAEAIVRFNTGDFGPAAGQFGIELMKPDGVLRRL